MMLVYTVTYAVTIPYMHDLVAVSHANPEWLNITTLFLDSCCFDHIEAAPHSHTVRTVFVKWHK